MIKAIMPVLFVLALLGLAFLAGCSSPTLTDTPTQTSQANSLDEEVEQEFQQGFIDEGEEYVEIGSMI